ncbi:MAG: DNA-binding response regulator [Flavobacteriales bacterium]|nr:DNA-binding response regulator [Flavobacteriales bacterium]MBO72691.1 DNA-binding response regulator [Flavobacteriales bacterium]|tara:strand:+ start:1080 stop:1844 length:765 start_codon:yes stop_codon:yes gene_type:complete
MANTKVFILEDENIVAKDIEQSLKKLGYEVIGTASSGEKVKELLESGLKPEIFLMDIMIKGSMDGIEVAEYVKENYNLPVIFLTAYADENTLSKAKITEPYGYILKPFKEIDLHTTIEMALYKHQKTAEMKKELDVYSTLVSESENGKDYIFVKNKSKLIKISVEDLFYVEALKDYVNFHSRHGKYTIHSTMKDVESKLPNKFFARVHRSFIVNLDKILSIEHVNGRLQLEGLEKSIPIGGSYKDELLEKFNLL